MRISLLPRRLAKSGDPVLLTNDCATDNKEGGDEPDDDGVLDAASGVQTRHVGALGSAAPTDDRLTLAASSGVDSPF